MEQWLYTYMEELKALCAIDSGHYHAPGVRAMVDFFRGRFEAMGLSCEVRGGEGEPFAPVLLAHNAGLDRLDALMIAHLDTVFEPGTGAARPLAPAGDGLAAGPGCVDCKGGCLMIEYLLRRLRRSDGTWPFAFCVVMNSDEERHSTRSRPIFEALAPRARYGFVFEPGRPQEQFVRARKGSESYEIRCRGIPAHVGASPWDGASAVSELARWVTALEGLADEAAGTSVVVQRFEGGGDSGSVPDAARFTMNCRCRESAGFAPIHEMLRRMQTQPFDPRTHIEVARTSDRPPMTPGAGTLALLDALRAAGERVGQTIRLIDTGGVSDGNLIAPFGPAVLDGCGPCGGKLHTPEEYIIIDSVARRLELMQALFEGLFYGKDDPA